MYKMKIQTKWPEVKMVNYFQINEASKVQPSWNID